MNLRQIFRLCADILIAVVLLLPAASCSAPDTFKIKGKIQGDPDMNVSVTYYNGHALATQITIAQKGEFEVECASDAPALVTIHDGSGHNLGWVYASPGDKITCTLDRANPYRISASGNPFTERWSHVSDSLADILKNESSEVINSTIEDYISRNPSDRVSALLFAKCYDASSSPQRADSVLRSINPEAQDAVLLESYVTLAHNFTDSTALAPIRELTLRTTTDSAYRYSPSAHRLNFIALSADRYDWRHDSVRHALRRLSALPKVQVLSLSLATDTFIWKRIVRQDSMKCLQGWLPGGVLAPGVCDWQVPALPYFIVTDSAGKQLLRTPSLTEAEAYVNANK